MTEVAGSVKQVGQGLTQKTFSYEPLNALIDIITNTAGKPNILKFRIVALIDTWFRSSCPGYCSETFFWWRCNLYTICHSNACYTSHKLIYQRSITKKDVVNLVFILVTYQYMMSLLGCVITPPEEQVKDIPKSMIDII